MFDRLVEWFDENPYKATCITVAVALLLMMVGCVVL